MIKGGLELQEQQGDILLISVHALLSHTQAKSKEAGDEFDIRYSSDRYGEKIKHPTEERYFFMLRKNKMAKWTPIIDSLLTPDQLEQYREMPDEFKPVNDEL